MRISKKNLLSLINENLKEMAMDFDTQDRPNRDIQNKLASGETPYKKVPFPETGDENKNFQELLASERYKQVVAKLRQFVPNAPTLSTNMGGIMPLQMLMMSAHNSIVETEREHREELERLAVELVMKEMGIPEGALQFNAKIVGVGEVDTQDMNRNQQQGQEEESIDIEQDLFNDLEKLSLEKAKRRFINSIIQGASERGHYMYSFVADKIREITGSEDIINQYGILMSINDTLYWQLSDEMMKAMMGGGEGEGSFAGKEAVDRNTTPPTINAQGINFPVLVHELIKGVMELFAIQGRPEDEETAQEVSSKEDTLEKENWDLRLGPAIWDKLRARFPEQIVIDENQVELQNYLLVEIFKLPPKKFFVFMREVLMNTARGAELMEDLMDAIDKMFNDEDYSAETEEFQGGLDDAIEEISSEDMNSFLKSIGIDIDLGNDFDISDEDNISKN